MKKESATFAAGCFWHVQWTFDRVPGVIETRAGYIGGDGIPSYDSAENKGFAEAVQVEFDSDKISYEELLNIFWNEHDATSVDRQGNDIGHRYRSAIFYHSSEQKKIAEESKQDLQEIYKDKIVTKIEKAGKFFPAEERHQRYLERNE